MDERTRIENTTLEQAEAGEYWVAVSYWKHENSVNTDVPHDGIKLELYTGSPGGQRRWPAQAATFYQPGQDLQYPAPFPGPSGMVTKFHFWIMGKIVWPGVPADRCSTGASPCVDVQPFASSYLRDDFPLAEMTSSPSCTERP